MRPLLRRVSEIADLAGALPGNDKRVVEIRESITEFESSSRIKELEARPYAEDM